MSKQDNLHLFHLLRHYHCKREPYELHTAFQTRISEHSANTDLLSPCHINPLLTRRQPFLSITSLIITSSPQYGVFSSSGASAICKEANCMQGEDQSDPRVQNIVCSNRWRYSESFLPFFLMTEAHLSLFMLKKQRESPYWIWWPLAMIHRWKFSFCSYPMIDFYSILWDCIK